MEYSRTGVRLPPPPPLEKSPSLLGHSQGRRVFYLPLFSSVCVRTRIGRKGLAFSYLSGAILHPSESHSFLSPNSLCARDSLNY